jgi:hypothetical protein
MVSTSSSVLSKIFNVTVWKPAAKLSEMLTWQGYAGTQFFLRSWLGVEEPSKNHSQFVSISLRSSPTSIPLSSIESTGLAGGLAEIVTAHEQAWTVRRERKMQAPVGFSPQQPGRTRPGLL